MSGHKCSSELSEPLLALPLSPFLKEKPTKPKPNKKANENTKYQRNTIELLWHSAHSVQESQQALLIWSVSISLVYLVYICIIKILEIMAKVTRIRLMFHCCVL